MPFGSDGGQKIIVGFRYAVAKEVGAFVLKSQTDVVSFFIFVQPSSIFIGTCKSRPGGKAGSVIQVFAIRRMEAPFAKPISPSIEYPPTDIAKPEMSSGNIAWVIRLDMFLTHEQGRCLQNKVSQENLPFSTYFKNEFLSFWI
jgi:hypothetical protein